MGTRIEPFTFMNNPRAESLRGEKPLKTDELLQKIIWYRERTEALRQYARGMERAMKLQGTSQNPWPNRPPMPSLGAQKIAKRKPLVMRGKARGLRLQALPQRAEK